METSLGIYSGRVLSKIWLFTCITQFFTEWFPIIVLNLDVSILVLCCLFEGQPCICMQLAVYIYNMCSECFFVRINVQVSHLQMGDIGIPFLVCMNILLLYKTVVLRLSLYIVVYAWLVPQQPATAKKIWKLGWTFKHSLTSKQMHFYAKLPNNCIK